MEGCAIFSKMKQSNSPAGARGQLVPDYPHNLRFLLVIANHPVKRTELQIPSGRSQPSTYPNQLGNALLYACAFI